jgi:hypothetical protein
LRCLRVTPVVTSTALFRALPCRPFPTGCSHVGHRIIVL